MAGHSHSANVARRKNSVDAKRAKIWSKIAKKITGTHWSGPRFFGLLTVTKEPPVKGERDA